MMSDKENGLEVDPIQGQVICSSLVEVSDGRSRPEPRRLLLTSTHLVVQRAVDQEDGNSSTRPTLGSVQESFDDEEEGEFDGGGGSGGAGGGGTSSGEYGVETPGELEKREVTLTRSDAAMFGISVRGGAEHSLPLIVSKLQSGSPAAVCRQIFIGDAIIAINGVKITRMDHDTAVNVLASSGPTVKLVLKYFPNATAFLSPTRQSLLDTNEHESWATEKTIPLTFCLLSRYLGSTDTLRCNGFEVKDSTGNLSSGIIHCADSHSLTTWVKVILDVASGLNSWQTKIWGQETGTEVYYVGWVFEGVSSSSSASEGSLVWTPKVLTFRGEHVYYMDYPPGVGSDWPNPEEEGQGAYPLTTTLLRVLGHTEHLDERQHCFSLQIALVNSGFPPTNKRQQPLSFYLSTGTRAELIRVEGAWTKAVKGAVKTIGKSSHPVWWGGKPCQLELDFKKSKFNLYRASAQPSAPLWTRSFGELKGSADDSRTRLTLKFTEAEESLECRDLHRVLFTIHSFLLARVVH